VTAAPGLDARVVVNRAGFDIDVAITATPGRTVAVVGPNGAGKTTFLRALAGLSRLDPPGHVTLDGQSLDGLAPERRPIGVVFQQPMLLPGLSALENVAFGIRHRVGLPKARAREEAMRWLERLDVADRAQARSHQLSGGEAQRVALARALATNPRLLLLDEPLAALDATTRPKVRDELRRHLAESPAVRLLVTHDPADATALADELLVLEDGRITQAGTAGELAAKPATPFVAELVGTNRYDGIADGRGGVAVAPGLDLVIPGTASGSVVLVIDPRAVTLHVDEPAGSARNVWIGRIDGIEVFAGRARVRIGQPVPIVAEVTPAAVAELGLGPGVPVWISVKAVEIVVV
jgi:molybdate transport system ATP-binding protein